LESVCIPLTDLIQIRVGTHIGSAEQYIVDNSFTMLNPNSAGDNVRPELKAGR